MLPYSSGTACTFFEYELCSPVLQILCTCYGLSHDSLIVGYSLHISGNEPCSPVRLVLYLSLGYMPCSPILQVLCTYEGLSHAPFFRQVHLRQFRVRAMLPGATGA